MNTDQEIRREYELWLKTFTQTARQANTHAADHEAIAREIESLDPNLKMIVVKAFLDAKKKFSTESGNFRSIAINNEIAYCFGFSDDISTRELWLLRSCLTVQQKNTHLKKLVGIATNKNPTTEQTYHFCMIDLTKETPENIAIH